MSVKLKLQGMESKLQIVQLRNIFFSFYLQINLTFICWILVERYHREKYDKEDPVYFEWASKFKY